MIQITLYQTGFLYNFYMFYQNTCTVHYTSHNLRLPVEFNFAQT